MATVRKRTDRDGYFVDFRIDGKRQRVSFRTKADAERFKVKILERKLGLKEPIERTRLKTAIQKYYDLVSSQKTTKDLEVRYFEKLYEFLCGQGIEYVDDVELLHLEELQNHLATQTGENKITNATVNRYFNTYKHFFSKCKAWKFHSEVPSDLLVRLPEKLVQRETWTPDQMALVMKHDISQNIKDAYTMVLMTGIRPIEACRLTWRDVNFDDGYFRAKSRKGSRYRTTERNVPMTPLVRALLLEIKAKRQRSDVTLESYVFLNDKGNKLTSQRLARVMAKVTSELKITGKSLYGFRHTLLTQMKDSGQNLDVIRQVAGHSSLITTQRYLHQTGVSKVVQDALEKYAKTVKR